MKYKFDCGCEFEQFDETIKPEDGLPPISINYYNIRYDCQLAWQIFYEGKTKGVFQLEKSLGKHWSKLVQPASIEEVAALVSLLRPGCLKAIVDGKSMTQHYADRKAGLEPVACIHESIQAILEPTYGVLTYQEQSMAIAATIAAFNLQQADTLRKAIGKKKADIMAKVKKEFIGGCQVAGIVDDAKADEIFGHIEKSNRYAFNKSHAVEYGEISYWTAYAKAHFPLHFFCAYLEMANEKIDPQEETQELVEDARLFGIDVFPPKIDEANFTISKHGIYFGLQNVKGMGQNHLLKWLEKLRQTQSILNKAVKDWTWYEMLVHLGEFTNKTVFNNLISVGVFLHTGMSRQMMLHEYLIWSKLTEREKNIIMTECSSLTDGIKYILDMKEATSKRLEVLKGLLDALVNPPYSTEDKPTWITNVEQNVLGVPVSCSRTDGINTSMANTLCAEFSDKIGKEFILAVEISSVREYITKAGKNPGQKMGFVTLKDNSGSIESVAFSNVWNVSKHLLYKGNVCLITGFKSDKGSLVINKIKEL